MTSGYRISYRTSLILMVTLSPQGWRRMVGCFIGMDEANSEARMQGV